MTRFSNAKGAGRCDDLSRNDVRGLRRLWPRRLIKKGILLAADAVRASEPVPMR